MTDPSLRIVFAGTPDFAADHLSDLLSQGVNVVAAYTQPDRPVGRGKQIRPTPVKEVAITHNIPVFQPGKLHHEDAEQLASLVPDVMVVVAYGLILSKEILEIPRFGCINVHASLLPRWRGAAPIERAILAGDDATGISIMKMDEGLDTGDVLLALETPIGAGDNAATITSRLLSLGNQGLLTVLSDLPRYLANAIKQNNAMAIYAKKLEKQEALVDWRANAIDIQHQVQAFFPRSPAYCQFQGNRLRILKALATDKDHSLIPGTVLEKGHHTILVACGKGALEISTIQFPGKNPLGLADVFNGRPNLFNPGDVLDDEQS